MTKLYIVVSNDLPLGLQSAQAVHCAYQFSQDHPEIHKQWLENSNTIVILAASSRKLKALLSAGEMTSSFREPDIGNKLTAIALGPIKQSEKLCHGISLCGREK